MITTTLNPFLIVACISHLVRNVCYAVDLTGDDQECASNYGVCLSSNEKSKESWTPTTMTETLVRQPYPCNLYYDMTPDGALGLFTATSIPQRHRVGQPDIVIQLVDPQDASQHKHLGFLKRYGRDAHVTGGQYEGLSEVFSLLPGIGMSLDTTNTHKKGNVIPFKVEVDEADLTRTESPGAGAISHYYNISYYALENLEEGDQILISTSRPGIRKSSRQLFEHGMCADNLKLDKSKIKEAGRGAFATKFIPKGALIAPVPVIPLSRQDLSMTWSKPGKSKEGSKVKEIINGTQLLINYCFGHKDSDILLYPYSPGFNFINHASGHDGNYDANAMLYWSSLSSAEAFNMTLDQLFSTEILGPIILDLVATRDIYPNEEIFLDYGLDWAKAWEAHVKNWKAVEDNSPTPYAPAYVMNEVADNLRTQEEQDKYYSYPDNLQLACFYKYSDMSKQKQTHEEYDKLGVTMVKWRPTKDITDLKYLRPCQILKRDEDSTRGTRYTVKMLNRPGNMTPPEERIPKVELQRGHLVSQVPRPAIRFVDKPYTTDQHLSNAFRQPIGLPDHLLPPLWERASQVDA